MLGFCGFFKLFDMVYNPKDRKAKSKKLIDEGGGETQPDSESILAPRGKLKLMQW